MTDFAPHIKALISSACNILQEERKKEPTLQTIAMQIAFFTANRAYHENRGGDALKALGSFWKIYTGYLDEEPQYEARAREYLMQLGV